MTNENMSGCLDSLGNTLKSQVVTLPHLVEGLKLRPALPNTNEDVKPVDCVHKRYTRMLIVASFIITRSKTCPTVGKSASGL